jgi:hypothetical protein
MDIHESKMKKAGEWEYQELSIAIDTSCIPQDINIIEAIVHILDNNADEPVLNEYKLDLGDEVYKFIYKHIERAFNDENLKYALFNEERNLVREVSQDYLNGSNRNLIEISKEISKQLFAIMKSQGNIPSCDLIVVSLSTDQGPMIGMLKLDYISNYTHKVDFIENNLAINLVKQPLGLPHSNCKIDKAAFIKPISMNQQFNLMVIDKINKKTNDEDYGLNYFTKNFLYCTLIENSRDSTKRLIDCSEHFTRAFINNDADKAEFVRSTIRNELLNEEKINISKLSDKLFENEPEAKKVFDDFIISKGINEEVYVDKKYVEKKTKRLRLNIDRNLDLYLDNETYNDKSKFEVVRNGDGTINMVLKNIINYIEK